MTRKLFEDIFYCDVFSHVLGALISSNRTARWSLINALLDAMNKHFEALISPSERMFVDKIISLWYIMGADYLSVGLSH